MVVLVVVYGFGGDKMMIDLCNDVKELQKITVLDLKKKIAQKLPGNPGENVDDLKLVFDGKRLNENAKALSEYGIKHISVIQMFAGEIEKADKMGSTLTTKEKCYDPADSTLMFVDREDELDCESRFVCGQFGCNAEWPYVEVRKMALLTPEEREYFERNMALNVIKDYFDSKTCPECKHTVTRKDQSKLCVCCQICTAKKGQLYKFCWQCLKEWKGSKTRLDRCENEGCENEALKTLRSCSEITFESVKGVTGCPSIRACPTCGYMLQHSTKNCKNITCSRCKVEFCFVCLKITIECRKTSKGNCAPCSDGVAPRQTSIPVWQKK